MNLNLMAFVKPTELTNGMGSSATNSYSTASITPTVGRLITVAVYNRRNGAIGTTPTVSGLSATWSQIVTKTRAVGDNSRFTIFRAVLTSSATGVLTISFGGVTQQMCHWHVVEWNNAKITGSNGSDGIRQSVGAESDTGSMTATLPSTITIPFNATYG